MPSGVVAAAGSRGRGRLWKRWTLVPCRYGTTKPTLSARTLRNQGERRFRGATAGPNQRSIRPAALRARALAWSSWRWRKPTLRLPMPCARPERWPGHVL